MMPYYGVKREGKDKGLTNCQALWVSLVLHDASVSQNGVNDWKSSRLLYEVYV